MSRYPREVYSYREDITRENMRKYDVWNDKIYAETLKQFPDYHKMCLREQIKAKAKVKAEIGNWS